VFDLFPESSRVAKLFDRKAFWLHSLSCGLIAKFLATKIKKFILFDPEEAFCAGLLHDIGKVVMEQYMHQEFHNALQLARHKKIPLFQAESQILGFNHTEVAEWLTNSWSLPNEIQLPLVYHHSLAAIPQYQDIINLCHLSDWLCYETGMVIDTSYEHPELQKTSLTSLQLQPSDIDAVKKELPEQIEKTSLFFEIAKSTKN
jgi:HD-like signal output (HDOD) protein